MTRVSYILVLALLLSACGTIRGKRPEGGLFNTSGSGGLFNAETREPTEVADSSSFKSVTNQNAEIMGVKLKNTNFDIPVSYNEEVLAWLEYFTGPGRKYFSIYMERMAKFEPIVLPKLRAAGLPEDLIYLSMIESGFSTGAKSHAGAVGPWQFIKSTGRLFGLRADWWVDERRDPVKSTDAAIEYLSRLYAEFGDWRLACAAYNSGEVRIRNAISRLGTRDFWTIARDRKAIRRETKDYVPKMMAAAIIGKNPEVFGFQKFEQDPFHVNIEEIKIPKAENLRTIASLAQVNKDILMDLNPELLRCCTPPQRGNYSIKIPKGDAPQRVMAAIENGDIGRYAGFRRHVIRRGDNLSKIASQHGVPVESILSMNEIRSVRGLKPGSELVIPERSYRESKRELSSVVPAVARSKNSRVFTYVVQKGDTLYTISRRYAVRIEQIRKWNSISSSKTLRPGSRLTLYVKNEKSENI